MPTIPKYTGPQLVPSPLRGGEQQASDPRARSGLQALGQGLEQVSEATDRIDLDIESRAAFAADTAVKAKWMQTDAALRQRYRGADAAGYVEETNKFWDGQREEQSKALSPRAQSMVGKSIGIAKQQAQEAAQHYFARETERAQDESFAGSQLGEIQRAAASGDPAVALVSSELLKQRNAQQAAIRGWSPEVLAQQNVKLTTMLHTNMIQGLQQADPHAAQQYFTQNKGEIDGTRHAEIAHSLTIATAANDGEVAAGDVWKAQGPKGYNDPVALDVMEDAIRKQYPNDVTRRASAISALRERASAFNTGQAEANASAVNSVMGTYLQTKSLAAMKKTPAWTQMPATKQAEIEAHVANVQTAAINRANAVDARTDAAEAREQRELARRNFSTYLEVTNPDKLAAMSENQVRAMLPVLGNDLTGHLMTQKRSLVKSADKIVEAKMDTDDFNHHAEAMGLRPFATLSGSDKEARDAKLGELKYRTEQMINAAQTQKGKALTRDEKNDLVRGEMARTVTVNPGMFSSNVTKPVIALSRDEAEHVVIPDTDRTQIVDALKIMAGRDPKNALYAPNEANMRRLYLLGKSRAATAVVPGVPAQPISSSPSLPSVDVSSVADKAATIAGNVGGSLVASVHGMNAGVYGTARAGVEVAGSLVGVPADTNPVAGWLKSQARAESDRAEDARPRTEGVIEAGIYSGIESVGTNVLALPLALMPGGAAAALTAMVLPVGGNAYNQARDGALNPAAKALKQQLRTSGLPHAEDDVQRAYAAVVETSAQKTQPAKPGPALTAVIKAELARAKRPATEDAVQAAYAEMLAAQGRSSKR